MSLEHTPLLFLISEGGEHPDTVAEAVSRHEVALPVLRRENHLEGEHHTARGEGNGHPSRCGLSSRYNPYTLNLETIGKLPASEMTVLHREAELLVVGPCGCSWRGIASEACTAVFRRGFCTLIFSTVEGEVVAVLVKIEVEQVELLLEYGFLTQILEGVLQPKDEVLGLFRIDNRCKAGCDDEHQYGQYAQHNEEFDECKGRNPFSQASVPVRDIRVVPFTSLDAVLPEGVEVEIPVVYTR